MLGRDPTGDPGSKCSGRGPSRGLKSGDVGTWVAFTLTELVGITEDGVCTEEKSKPGGGQCQRPGAGDSAAEVESRGQRGTGQRGRRSGHVQHLAHRGHAAFPSAGSEAGRLRA